MESSLETGFLSGSGGRLYFRAQAADDPRGFVVLIHGFAEHSGRYLHVMEAFARAGLSTLALDLRGHGQSSGTTGAINRFDDYLKDVKTALDAARARAEGRPLFILGHSMGGLVVARALLSPLSGVRAAALSSPYMMVRDKVPFIKELAAKLLSRLVPNLGIPSGLDPNHVSRDAATVRAYRADPLVFSKARARWYTEIVATQAYVQANAKKISLPVLMIQGGDDRIVDPAASRRLFDRLGATDKRYEEPAGLFHEVMNEPERAEIIASFIGWFQDHIDA